MHCSLICCIHLYISSIYTVATMSISFSSSSPPAASSARFFTVAENYTTSTATQFNTPAEYYTPSLRSSQTAVASSSMSFRSINPPSSSANIYAQASVSSSTVATASNATSVESAQSSNEEPQRGMPLGTIIGIIVTVVFVVVAGVIGRVWFRHRKARAARRDARELREIGREKPSEGSEGGWLFEPVVAVPPTTRPTVAITPVFGREIHRESVSTWADDSEMDMMATDGSSIGRTLSTRSSTSTIRTISNQVLDHPGHTYQTATRSTPSTFLNIGRRAPALRSPFDDSSSSPQSLQSISPFTDPTTSSNTSPSTSNTSPSDNSHTHLFPRAESRISTTSSENPFRDPLPVYTLQGEDTDILSTTNVPVLGETGGFARQLQRPPPAYVEMERRGRS